MRLSTRDAPSPPHARATASARAEKSLPSTVTPGIAQATARSAIWRTPMLRLVEVDMPERLFSRSNTTGSIATAARFSDSRSAPSVSAPSP